MTRRTQTRTHSGMGNEQHEYRLVHERANTTDYPSRATARVKANHEWLARRERLRVDNTPGAFACYVAPVALAGFTDEQRALVRDSYIAGKRSPVPEWLQLLVEDCYILRTPARSGYVLPLGRFRLRNDLGLVTATLNDMSGIVSPGETTDTSEGE
jgi:hypothetical protein